MRKTGKEKLRGLSISLPALLAVLMGLSLLYCLIVFRWYRQIGNEWLLVGYIAVAVLLVCGGAADILLGLMSSSRTRRSVGRPCAPPRWLSLRQGLRVAAGLALFGGGALLAVLIAVRAESGLTVILGVTVGTLLSAAGIRSVVSALRPSFAETQQRRQHLTLPGIVYLVIMSTLLVASMMGRSNMLLLVFALMAGPFVLNGWVTSRMLRQVRVSRRLASRGIMAGEVLEVELQMENRKRWLSSCLMDVTDTVSGREEELRSGVLFVRVPPRGTERGTYRLSLRRRGRYRFGPMSVTTRFPLGFVERGVEITAADSLVVYPRVGQLTAAWHRERESATELVEAARQRFQIYEDEFHRIREYRGGDNPRAIHWRTSARRNELMVREYRQNRENDLLVLLDLWQPARPTPEQRGFVELAVSFAATLCLDHLTRSRESLVTVIAGGREIIRWEGRSRAAALESVLEMLALLEAGPQVTPAALLREAQPSFRLARHSVAIFTDPRRSASLRSLREAEGGNGSAGNWQTCLAHPAHLGRYFTLTGEGPAKGGRP